MTPPAPKLRLVLCNADPAAWVVSVDECRDSGRMDAMAWQAGEFSTPLYAASPNRGLLPADMLERAARGAWEKALEQAGILGDPNYRQWSDLSEEAKRGQIERQRAAFAAAGIECEKEGG